MADRIVSFLASPDPAASKTAMKKPKGVKVRVCESKKLASSLADACSASSSSLVGSVGLSWERV